MTFQNYSKMYTRDIVNGKEKEKIVYEDEKALAVLSDKPKAKGHVLVFAKELYADLDKVPDDMFVHLMTIASFTATVQFESGAKGTNIVMCNGDDARFDHFYIDIIPRDENDKVGLKWEFKQGNPEKIKKIAEKIKDETFMIGKERPKKEVVDLDEKKEEEPTDYMVDQLNRIP